MPQHSKPSTNNFHRFRPRVLVVDAIKTDPARSRFQPKMQTTHHQIHLMRPVVARTMVPATRVLAAPTSVQVLPSSANMVSHLSNQALDMCLLICVTAAVNGTSNEVGFISLEAPGIINNQVSSDLQL